MARDLRLRPGGRGRAPALRPGGAWRPALVRPRAGLPHRGAGPGQGAAGQERRHRAGRRQGRLLPEAARPPGCAATWCSRPAGRPMSISSPACCRSPTISTAIRWCRRRASCAATATTPISSSPPTRARRPSPTRPTRISQAHGFWLDDAFASGGSAGYDHKKMGITAKGAWEAVKRHFREMNRDIQTDALHRRRRRRHVGRRVRQRHAAVAQTRLIAAFDHRDIFIDPEPGHAALRSPSGSGCSRCRARAGRTTTSPSCRRAASSSRAARSRSRCRRRPPRRSGSTRRPLRRPRS